MTGPFSALRILIVEDEYYLADDLAEALRSAGAEVIGPVGTLGEAEAIVQRERLDCAILDMNLHGDMAYPVADRLEGAGIPFIIATGYNSASLPERFSKIKRVEKPFNTSEVAAAIPEVLGRSGGGNS